MKNVIRRILLVLVGLPLIFGLILVLDELRFLGFNLLVIIFSGIGAMECADIISGKLYKISKTAAFFTGISLPLAAYFSLFPAVPGILPVVFLFIVLGIILGSEAFRKTEQEIGSMIRRTSAHAVILVYPGLFAASMVYITTMPNPMLSIIIFLVLVFGNDSFAYIFGMLFGRKSTNIFAVSPNKSLAGFIGGLAGTIGISYLFSAFFPDYFPLKAFSPALAGLTVFLVGNIGDLVESALKRSAGVKDSGTMIPGRGGVLDSIDSLLFTSPFFIFVFRLIYQLSRYVQAA